MPAILQLDQITRRFGVVEAVAGASLAIAAGERVALIGASGSGKTTMLRLMGAQIAPDAGTVNVFQCDPGALSPADLRRLRSRVAFIPQNLGLVPNLRVIQNVAAGRAGSQTIAGTVRDLLLPPADDRVEVLRTLDRVGIAEKMYDRVDHLSGGQQQRVAVARALYQRPEILLADEPVSAVDPARARSMLDLLVGLSEEEGLTLVVSLHQVALAREFFPRLAGLHNGRLLFDAEADSVDGDALDALYRIEAGAQLE